MQESAIHTKWIEKEVARDRGGGKHTKKERKPWFRTFQIARFIFLIVNPDMSGLGPSGVEIIAQCNVY